MGYKKAFVILIIFVVLGYGVKTYVLDKNTRSVKGVSAQKEDKNVTGKSHKGSLQMEEVVKDKLETLKKEVGSLNISDIASDSPQVQKIINDLNALKGYPKSELKNACRKICESL